MARSNIAKLAAYTLGGSVLAGAGLAAGRDAWKSFKNNPWPVLFIFAVFGFVAFPYLAGREFFRGHDRGFLATVFKTMLGSVALFLLGLGCGYVVIGLFYGIFLRGPDIDSDFVNATTVDTANLLSFAIAGLGTVVGLWQRPKRKRAFRIADENDRFLDATGIVETGGKSITHRDRVGNELRLLESHNDRLVFLAVGRRNRRAYIQLDDQGQMIDYTGVVRMGGGREDSVRSPKISNAPIGDISDRTDQMMDKAGHQGFADPVSPQKPKPNKSSEFKRIERGILGSLKRGK